MLEVLNLKQALSAEDVKGLLEIKIEEAKIEGKVAFKILHGYGSSGKGGVLLTESRRVLKTLKQNKKISDFFGGEKWNLFDESTIKILKKDKSIALDPDLNSSNPGITIVVL